jgi:hypothetical protein
VNEYDSPSALVRPVMTQSVYRCSSPSQDGLTSTSSVLPLAEEVVRRTDQVTKRIQELWASMQDLEGRDTFVPCAERIRVAVAELSAIFPQVIHSCTLCSVSLTGQVIIGHNIFIIAPYIFLNISEYKNVLLVVTVLSCSS